MTRLGFAALLIAAPVSAQQGVLYRSKAFTVTDTSVEQGRYRAVAVSRDTMLSSYPRSGREVHYKFSLNSQENEFPPGIEHTLFVRPRDGRIVTPVHTFGVRPPPPVPTPEESGSSEEGMARVTFRVDLRHVLRDMATRGGYTPPNGPAIRAGELQGVYVIGSPEPLTWDYRSLRPGSPLQLTDPDRDSVYTVTLPVEATYTRPLAADGRALWARHRDLSGFPQLTSPQRLLDALYRMSLEELQQLVRPDGALSAGAKWEGVWTRDVSLSVILSLAMVAPDATRKSLMAKVDSAGRIIQDTGTGGSWPVSTDRMVWSLAAWELYASTGDREWLRTSYDIIRRSAEADLHAAFDRSTGLFRGESSFMDWREQSYPRWMDPKDIYQGQSLSTNVIHFATYRVLGDMARALGRPAAEAARWGAVADSVRRGIDAHFWQPARGWYGEFRYGRNFLSLSPRAEGLGEALSLIYGVPAPERGARLFRSAPVTEFGEPSFWPYIPDLPLYHNAAIWPFVTTYWTWAAADAGATAAVEHGLANIERAAALFLTNKENMVAATGHFEGTVLNSDGQLWSVAGTLASTYRILFGMRLRPDRLDFRPMVPRSYAGERALRGLRYRGATLDVVMRGFGDSVASARLDGRPLARAEIPATLTGAHTLELELNGRWPTGEVNIVESRWAPETPVAAMRGGDTLAWAPVAGVSKYVVYRNARPVATTTATAYPLPREAALAEYQVLSVDSTGLESFLSEPVRVLMTSSTMVIAKPAAEPLRLTLEQNTSVKVPIRVLATGTYTVDVRYANGNGPINTRDMTAVRTLLVDGKEAGVLVMPQRGTDLWTDWGYSNPLRVRLAAGAHTLTISYTPLDANMNRRENTALLDHVRVTRLPSAP